MSANTQTIRVRILPGIRMWQLLLVAVVIVASLMLGLLVGRSNAPASAATTFNPGDFRQYACTGHVPKRACHPVEVGFVTASHVPPGGYPKADQ